LIVSRVNDGNRCGNHRARVSAAAQVRNEGESFAASFDELKSLVSRACGEHGEWEAKVVAGIQAAVDFVAANPGKARALTVEARRPNADDQAPAADVITYFADLLGQHAPAEKRAPISRDESIVEAIAVVIRGHLLAGTAKQLPETAPDLVYLALLPYLGLAETRGWTNALALRKTSG
jgi:hypothetical protein